MNITYTLHILHWYTNFIVLLKMYYIRITYILQLLHILRLIP